MCGYHVKKLTLGEEFLSVDQATLPEIKVGRSNFEASEIMPWFQLNYALKTLTSLLKWIKEKYYSELKPKTVYQGSSTSRPLFIQIFHLKSLHDLCSTFFLFSVVFDRFAFN